MIVDSNFHSCKEHRLVFFESEFVKNEEKTEVQQDKKGEGKEEKELRLDIATRSVEESLANVGKEEEGLTRAKGKLKEAYDQAIDTMQKQIEAFGDAPITKNWKRDLEEMKARRAKMEGGKPNKEELDQATRKVESSLYKVNQLEKQAGEGKDVSEQLKQAYEDAIAAQKKQIELFGDSPITKNWQRDLAELARRRDQLPKGKIQSEKKEIVLKDLTQTAETLHKRLQAGDKEVKPLQVFEAYSNAMAALNKEIRAYEAAKLDIAPPNMTNEYYRLNDQRKQARDMLTEQEEAELSRIVREANKKYGEK